LRIIINWSNDMKQYEIEIVGDTPLLMHQDNIEWSDMMDEWKADAANKKISKAGDDRSPAFRWIGSTYHDDNVVAMPSDNLMRCIMEGGSMVPVPGAKGNKTFKSQTQSGMMVAEPFWPLTIDGKTVPMSEIRLLMQVKDFAAHRAKALELGFKLHVKRAKIGAAKHIRVRPCFDRWTLRGTINVWDEQITDRVLTEVLTLAGRYKGLGDWRPGSKTPGSWGMFKATVRSL
jgi:hypothetical protein